jgi:hypothetical protein
MHDTLRYMRATRSTAAPPQRLTFGLLYAFSRTSCCRSATTRWCTARARCSARWRATTGRSSQPARLLRLHVGLSGQEAAVHGAGVRPAREWSESAGARLVPAGEPHAPRACKALVRDLNRLYALRAGAACARLRARGLRVADRRRARELGLAWLRKAPGAAAGRGRHQLHAGAERAIAAPARAPATLARDPQHRRDGLRRLGGGNLGGRREASGTAASPRTVFLPPLRRSGSNTTDALNDGGGGGNGKADPAAGARRDGLCAGRRPRQPAEGADRPRAKPAVYFGGKTRIIDFALSNALNSGIRRIGVATQYKAHSLIRHLQRGWNFLRPERNESFDILPASQRVSETQWYEGTADAVFQNIDIIESYGPSSWSSSPATTSTRWTTS